MKKYFSILVAVMFAALSFTLTSCGDDDEKDEPTTGSNFTINGMAINTSAGASADESSWNSSTGKGSLVIPFIIKNSDGSFPASLYFSYKSDSSLKIGDDLASKQLTLRGLGSYTQQYKVTSGSAVVKKVSGNEVTIEFNELTLFCDNFDESDGEWMEVPALNKAQLVINGTATTM